MLRHVHLPTLDERGFVDWVPESGEVSRGPNWNVLAPMLRLLDDYREELPDGWLAGEPTTKLVE